MNIEHIDGYLDTDRLLTKEEVDSIDYKKIKMFTRRYNQYLISWLHHKGLMEGSEGIIKKMNRIVIDD